jgi:predicted nuclease of restriction endonuclease-like (RecB) superfamily
MNFKQLSELLVKTNKFLVLRSVNAININLTIRNWIFGYYIVEFEQQGQDRASYGKKLLDAVAKEIKIKGLTAPELSRCRQFYLIYPQILGSLSQEFPDHILKEIFGTLSQIFFSHPRSPDIKAVPDYSKSADQNSYLTNLIKTTSFSHFVELIKIDDPVKRQFYELLIFRTTPSVRELRRQIETLTYERFGLSSDKNSALIELSNKISPVETSDLVKSHYFFEFLNISKPQLVEESELEQALIDHLQDFILELGNGFCFEARQKRILIDDEYYFIDLVFYHRILKCHVLIELKTEHAKHEHIGQLKVYLQHYKQKEMSKDDNPPVGILLVTDKKKTLVEYAMADSDKKLFISKYQLQLPDKEALKTFINKELRIL